MSSSSERSIIGKTILLVDDSKDDVFLLRLAFKKAEFNNPLQTVGDGEKAISYLEGRGAYADRNKFPLPAVILLDLNMPKKGGFDVLTWLRAQPALKRIMVIVLTASMRREDVEQSFDLGANAFLVKPGAVDELTAMLRCLRDWLSYNHFPPFEKGVKQLSGHLVPSAL